MVGASGRSAGKTQFACSLIRKFSLQGNVTGLKVTAVGDAESGCPRGQGGCGVCSELKGHYSITEETDSLSDKDTSRMLASGAGRVFWLRVLKTHLAEGISEFMDIVGRGEVLVCESNSLREVVEPDVFIMIEGSDVKDIKASAEKVYQYADRIVHFDGNGFDIATDDVELVGRRWAVKMWL